MPSPRWPRTSARRRSMSDETQAPEAGAESTEQAPQVDLSNIQEAIDGRFSAIERTIQDALQTRQQPEQEADPYADVYGYADPLGLNVPSPEQEDDSAALR